MTIAVLLTTFNRKQKTLSCLESLQAQDLPAGVMLKIFLTDDNSADGTAAAVKKAFPEVNLYTGTGELYWAGGMRHTWRKALNEDTDYYLLINDDTLLLPGSVAALLKTSRPKSPEPALVIGSTCDQASGEISYGGWNLRSPLLWKSERVEPGEGEKDCDFGNANLLLVPRAIVEKIGILADHFTHSLADYDYTMKAKKAGCTVKLAPGFLGYCIDDHGRNWKSQKTTLKERISYLKSPKGLAYKEYLRFIKDHFPLSYPSAFLQAVDKDLFPFHLGRLEEIR